MATVSVNKVNETMKCFSIFSVLGSRFYQTRHAFCLTIGALALHENAF